MNTYTYKEITVAAKQIVSDELYRAEKETDSKAARHLRSFAAGAWLLWQCVPMQQCVSRSARGGTAW
jgi:hypothetical protein